MYDYRKHLQSDILHYIFVHYDEYKNRPRAVFEEDLFTTLWYTNEVTGNGRHDYFYFHELSVTPEEIVSDNTELLQEAMEWFAMEDAEFIGKFTASGYIFLDTLIRLYLLKDCISAVLNVMQIYD